MFALCFGKHVSQPSGSASESGGGGEGTEWTSALADWIRHNDDVVLKSMAKVLSTFQVSLYCFATRGLAANLDLTTSGAVTRVCTAAALRLPCPLQNASIE